MGNIGKKLNSITWSDLRRYGTNPVLKSSYFWLAAVPIAAKLLLQLSQPLVFHWFGREHTVFLHLPFSWSAFYFSAVAFAVASGLFALFCPRMVKQYSSFGEFFRESSGARELLDHYFSLDKASREDVLPGLYVEAHHALRIPQPRIGPRDPTALQIEAVSTIRRVKREEMTDIFSTLRHAHDKRFPLVRKTVVIFYAIGFVLIGFVALQNLIWVTKALVH
jgi:hypothetical protein